MKNFYKGKYVMQYDYHTHTKYSDGKGEVLDNAKAAVSLGLKGLAITDHGPGHKLYGVDRKNLPAMRADIKSAAEELPELQIYMGVEANIIDTPSGIDITKDEFGLYDFIIAGYHCAALNEDMQMNGIGSQSFVPPGSTENLRNRNTDMAVRCLYENNIKILTHPGDKGPFDIKEISKACADTDTLMEINDTHEHMTASEIRIAEEFDVKFIINSDAHLPNNVGNFKNGVARVLENGLDISRIVNIGIME